MLISAVLPIMTLYRLPHGQYGYSGHIINLPQDVASLADKLPRTPADLDVVVIRKEGAVGHHRDFRVRRSVVLHALEWLTINNTYYRNVTIDHDVLALLPIDGHLSGPSLFAGLDYWTGILDWTTGLQFLYLEFNFYGSSFNEY